MAVRGAAAAPLILDCLVATVCLAASREMKAAWATPSCLAAQSRVRACAAMQARAVPAKRPAGHLATAVATMHRQAAPRLHHARLLPRKGALGSPACRAATSAVQAGQALLAAAARQRALVSPSCASIPVPA